MPTLKPYPAYADTNLPWLPKIPKHWDLINVKRGYDIRLGKMLRPEPLTASDTLELYLRAANVQWQDVNIDDVKEMWFSPWEKPLYELRTGDLMVCEGGDVGRAAIWQGQLEKCYIQNSIHRVRNKEGFTNKFLYYWLVTLKDKGYIDLLCNKATIAHFTADKFAAIELIAPPLPEQRTIAAYLDRQTAKIDALIAKKQRLLDLLAEQRAALISQAVTKGNALNKVQKDKSPAPWLFPLPDGWKRKQLKHISFTKGRIGYENLRADEYTEEGPYLVSSVHFKDGRIEWDKCNHVTRERFEMSPDIILQKGDVLFMKDGALMGKLAFVDDLPGEACLNSHILLIRPLKGSYLPKFLLYVLMTDVFKAYMEEMAKGTTFLGFSEQSMGNFPLSLPSLDEQKEIVDYLDHQTKRLSDLATKIETAIERLQEYRAALISSVVTGKVMVKDE